VPIPPRWLADQMAARGGRLSGVLRAEPKARHGRRELRTCWALADPKLLRWVGSTGEHRRPWPHLRQIIRIERHRIPVRRGVPVGEPEVEVVYWITSLAPTRADAAALLRWQRGHWSIENRLHYIRDTAFDEDRCTVRSGAAPQLLAACRNLALALLRREGHTNIAAALRSNAARPTRLIRRLATTVMK
jgi:hypothetical protein